MKWTLFSVIFVILYHFGDSDDLMSSELPLIRHEREIDCDDVCHRSNNELTDGITQELCQCSTQPTFDGFESENHIQLDIKDRLFKRDTLQDLTTKLKNRNAARKSLNSLPTGKINNNALKKKTMNNIPLKTKYAEQQQKQPVKYKELQDRFKDFKMRMSGNPKLGVRGNFDEDGNRDNIIQQFKKKQEELKEKMKIGNVKPLVINTKERQNTEFLNKLQHNFHSGDSKLALMKKNRENKEKLDKANKKEPNDDADNVRLGSALPNTTVAPKISQIPVIVLTSSTSTTPQPAPVVNSSTNETTNAEKNESDTKKSEPVSSAIEKIKGKQKEVVSKILDKISKAS